MERKSSSFDRSPLFAGLCTDSPSARRELKGSPYAPGRVSAIGNSDGVTRNGSCPWFRLTDAHGHRPAFRAEHPFWTRFGSVCARYTASGEAAKRLVTFRCVSPSVFSVNLLLVLLLLCLSPCWP